MHAEVLNNTSPRVHIVHTMQTKEMAEHWNPSQSTEKRFKTEVFNCITHIMVSKTERRFSRVRKVAELFLLLPSVRLVFRSDCELEAACMMLGTSHITDINSK